MKINFGFQRPNLNWRFHPAWLSSLKFSPTIKALLCLIVFIQVNACDGPFWKVYRRESLQNENVGPQTGRPLTVVIHKNNWSNRKHQGSEIDLMQSFAHFHSYKIDWKVVSSEEQVIESILQKTADVAIGTYPTEFSYVSGTESGISYAETGLALICPEQVLENSVNNLSDFPVLLPWKLKLPSVESELMDAFPKAKIKVMTKSTSLQGLLMAQRNQKACVVVEAPEARFWLRLTADLQLVHSFSQKVSLSFLIHPQNEDLQVNFRQWFQESSRNREYTSAFGRYFGHLEALTDNDIELLKEKRESSLPSLKSLFESSAKDFDLPWQLVAAVAFQESHWNNHAESFTGVKGIMQITKETASHLGIEDRGELAQSVWGGAKYLRSLLNRVPKHLHQRERLALALATYNVGVGHMRDAQKLAVRTGKNPHRWQDLKQVLPLLSEPSYFTQLEFGRARGQEPVDFTDRVLGYFDLLSLHDFLKAAN